MKRETAAYIILVLISAALIVARVKVTTIAQLPEKVATKIVYLFESVKRESGEKVRSIVEANRILKENQRLEEENIKLKQKITLCKTLYQENLKLKKLLGIKKHYKIKSIAARVLGWTGDYWQLRFMLDKGSKDGVKEGMAVAGSNGIVGQIRKVYKNYSVAMSVVDPDFSVHVEDFRSKVRGIARGNGRTLNVNYVLPSMDVKVGDLLVATGIGGIFPTGLYIGRVIKVSKSLEEKFLNIVAVPTDRLENNKFVLIMGEVIGKEKKEKNKKR